MYSQRIDEKTVNYLDDADMNEHVGTYVIRNVTAENHNEFKYFCLVSRVGPTSPINFTVIGK